MSIFIAELGFTAQPEFLLTAKTGVLAASLMAGVLVAGAQKLTAFRPKLPVTSGRGNFRYENETGHRR